MDIILVSYKLNFIAVTEFQLWEFQLQHQLLDPKPNTSQN